jgi:hypothetical protein
MDVITFDASGHALGVVRDCVRRPWLLRNDEVRSLSPLDPPLRSIFTGSGGRGLDLAGPDGIPTPGTGDDDDAHVDGIASGWLDTDAGLGDPDRPLVFYQVQDASGKLRLSRIGSTGIRIEIR